ncbi:hypothetical protein [Hydrogenophaga intermedia]|uniref:Uncharacterized protein n=1 Tax=Hydrogenophaga intermedia TaxID=65786 RepID=A0A1L1PSB4_HYDIT|nr:hypothetical protein [Hydrogenophaga intermedia]TMU72432.1 hypothetical protein FGJ01_18840 [Hydrogenophaga intermedia]CDN87491.1 hypothetical protein BN948_01913 [Hydrogenophaga intermedia]
MMPISGSAGGGGPSNASSAANSSGWVVNFGSGGVNTGGSGDMAQYLPYAVLLVGALIAVSYFKRKK